MKSPNESCIQIGDLDNVVCEEDERSYFKK